MAEPVDAAQQVAEVHDGGAVPARPLSRITGQTDAWRRFRTEHLPSRHRSGCTNAACSECVAWFPADKVAGKTTSLGVKRLDDFHHVLPWQNLCSMRDKKISFSGLTALTAEFTVGEGKLMTHDEPCSMAPDDKHDLISGTCSHLP